jgi:hypothetical protein
MGEYKTFLPLALQPNSGIGRYKTEKAVWA